MSIFAIDAGHTSQQISERSSKVEKFRLQIRRKQQEQKFAVIRKQFVESLKSLNFLHELNSQKDNITAKKIDWLINGLEGGQNNATFYQDIMDMQLESCLCQIVFDQEIKIQCKTKILKSLVQLTYYSCKIPKDFLQNNFIDYMRVQLGKIDLQNQNQSDFAFQCASLVANLTSFRNEQFNSFMVESDFLPNLQKLVDKPTYSDRATEYSMDIRQYLLDIYKILFEKNQNKFQFISKTLKRILIDDRNLIKHDVLCSTLRCMIQAAKIQKFWKYLQSSTNQNGEIYHGFDMIIHQIKNNFNLQSFNLLVQFLVELYENNESLIRQEVDLYIQNLPQQFLIECIFQLQNNSESSKHKLALGKTVKLISHIKTLSKNVYRNKIEQQRFITAIMVRYVATNSLYAKYLVRVLCKVLEQDKTAIDILIDNGIIDMIRDFLDSDFFKQQKIDVINLIEKLIETEEELRNKSEGENKMLSVFYHRSIINDIEKLQDDPVPEVYKRAELFLSRLSQISPNSQENRK